MSGRVNRTRSRALPYTTSTRNWTRVIATNMTSFIPSHDVWLAMLNLMIDDDQLHLKHCSLVCRSWHAYLRLQLMESVLFHEAHYPASYD
jgi:hypothetical protein